ncbi:unnamed protein product, partial [Brenthis ino]
MAEETDFNDVLENIFLSENIQCQKSYEEGYKIGCESGNPEGYHLGYHKGAELGRELGYYLGIVSHHLENSASNYSEKIVKQLEKVKDLIDTFPRTNSEEDDILGLAENIRFLSKHLNLLAKYKMNTIGQLHQKLDSTIKFLTPLLPLANCHMVEFFTENHWEKLIPYDLRKYLNDSDMNDVVDQFWRNANGDMVDNNPLSKWIHNTKSHCVILNNNYCISTDQLQELIKSWGGTVKPQVQITEFMTSKKSYEVQTMSNLIASLNSACGATHCVEAGGGKGNLPIALTLYYNMKSLTVDCDQKTIENAEKRVKIIQKQWHAIAKRIQNGSLENISRNINSNIHRFASTFITKDTNFAEIIKQKFPEDSDTDVKLLLTGLHTCGNLGPDSLRIFASQPWTAAVFNVPCCYHHLNESVDDQLYDVFQQYGGDGGCGFPMSEWLRGFNLGRNARMLAAQSIDRVVQQRQLPDTSLLYRALLQVIIKTHLPDLPLSEGKLKGISSKCQNFNDYFKMADDLLKLNMYEIIPETYLTDIQKNMNCQWKKIVIFYLLRLCLAQVIESVILLDRLLFLFENGFEKVYLVKLFDPVLSPRCHSIVAVR